MTKYDARATALYAQANVWEKRGTLYRLDGVLVAQKGLQVGIPVDMEP